MHHFEDKVVSYVVVSAIMIKYFFLKRKCKKLLQGFSEFFQILPASSGVNYTD
jgi:hypothetical protein